MAQLMTECEKKDIQTKGGKMIKIITLVLKAGVLPYWVFKSLSEYAIVTLNVNPTLAFIVSAAAAFGTLAVSIKIPI